MRRVVVVTCMVLAFAACGDDGSDAGGGPPAGPTGSGLALTSPAFGAGSEIPDGFTCDGANASPPLMWSGVPDDTAELALTVVDPDAPGGEFVHWVVWGIGPDATELPEADLPDGAVEGANGANAPEYLGPCPLPGDPAHRYVFTLYALSAPLDLDPGATEAEFAEAVGDLVVAQAELSGTYDRA